MGSFQGCRLRDQVHKSTQAGVPPDERWRAEEISRRAGEGNAGQCDPFFACGCCPLTHRDTMGAGSCCRSIEREGAGLGQGAKDAVRKLARSASRQCALLAPPFVVTRLGLLHAHWCARAYACATASKSRRNDRHQQARSVHHLSIRLAATDKFNEAESRTHCSDGSIPVPRCCSGALLKIVAPEQAAADPPVLPAIRGDQM